MAGSDTLYDNPNYTISSPTGWVNHAFTTGLIYSGGNLVIGTDWNNDPANGTQSVDWSINSAPDQALGRVGSSETSSLNFTTSTLYKDKRPSIRIYYTSVPGLDLSLSSFITPNSSTPVCTPTSDVEINVENINTDPVTSFQISWEINGVAQTPFAYTGATLNNGDNTLVVLGTGVSLNAGDEITAYISQINGAAAGTQTTTLNDTLTLSPVPVGLNGTYSIGATGTPDFATIDAAFSALEVGGFCGPVTFDIQSGTYDVNATLNGPITGSSATNTLTVRSQTGNASDVTLRTDATATGDNFALLFNNTQFVTVEHLTFLDNNFTDNLGRLLEFDQGFTDITVTNNVFLGDSTANIENQTSGNIRLLGLEDNTNPADNLTVTNNTFSGGTYGIVVNGPNAPNLTTNVTVADNLFRNYSFRGLYFDDASGVLARDNRFRITTTDDGTTALWADDLEDFTFESNDVFTNTDANGFELLTLDPGAGVARIYNNVISIGQDNGTGPCIGMHFDDINQENIEVHHNTVWMRNSTSTTTYAYDFEDTGILNNVFTNNIGQVDGEGAVLYAGDPAVLATSDYNVYHTTGNAIVADWDGTTATTLADLQTANSQDANSISVDPQFPTPDLLSPFNSAVEFANPIAHVSVDIEDATRNTTPGTVAAGAYIFDIPAGTDLAIGEALHEASQPFYCGAADDLEVSFSNVLGTAVNSAVIEFSVNGGTPTPVNYNPTTALGAGETDTLLLATAIAPADGDVIEITITQVNGSPDDDATNNTLSFTVQTGLSGPTVVGPGGTAAYPDLPTAFTALTTRGMCATVQLLIEPGTYDVSTELVGPVNGLGGGNNLIISSQTANANDVTLRHAAATTTDNFVLRFDDVNSITLTNLTFLDNDFTDALGTLIEFENEISDITVSNSVFLGDTTANAADETTANMGLVTFDESGDAADNVTINNNQFWGGTYGVDIDGPNTPFHSNFTVTNNLFYNYSHYGAYFFDTESVTVADNTFLVTNPDAGTHALFIDDAEDVTVESNLVYTENQAEGFLILGVTPGTGVARVYNNVISLGQDNSTDESIGIHFDDVSQEFVEVSQNSVWIRNSTNADAIAYDFEDTGIDDNSFTNNIGQVDGAGTVLFAGDDLVLTSSDYNVYNTTGAAVVAEWDGTVATTLADLQTASGLDVNSIAVDPQFVALDSLAPLNPSVQFANPIAYVTADIRDSVRNTTAGSVTAGAYKFVILPGTDLSAAEAIHPAASASPYCGDTADLSFSFSNISTDPVSSAVIEFTVDGGTPTQVNYTPATPLAGGETDTVLLAASQAPVDGTVIEIYISTVNGAADDDQSNDTLSFTVSYGIDGAFVVGPSAAADYANFQAAFTALEDAGMCGPVTFSHESGTFAEQADLNGPIAGLSAANRLTVTSVSGNAADVVLTQNATADADNRVLRFSGINYTTVSNLTFEDVETGATASEHSRLVEFLADNVGNEVRNNVFIGDTSTLVEDNTDFGEDLVLLHLEQNTLADSIQIIGNQFFGGSRGIICDGPAGDSTVSAVIEDNLFENYGYKAIEIDDNRNFVVNNNTFQITNGFVDGTAIEAEDFENGTFTNNQIYSPNHGIGMDLDDTFTSTGGQNIISNNVVNLGATGSTVGSEGIIVGDGDNMLIYHNTIRIYGATATTADALQIDNLAENVTLENNILAVNGTDGYALVIEDPTSIVNADYNNIISSHTNASIDVDGTDYTDLAGYQGGTTFGVNSISVDPLFADVANDDLSVCEQTLALANPIASVTEDILGETRDPATPTVGAYEVTQAPTNPFLGPDLTICEGTPTTIGIADLPTYSYSWNTVALDTNEISISTAGDYILEVTTACGTSIDTVIVDTTVGPTADFTSTQGATKFDYTFTNASTGSGLTYDWDFGDGSVSTDENPVHTYSSINQYTVTLTVTDSCGNTSVFTDAVDIPCDAIAVDFSSQADAGNPLEITFTDLSSGDIETWDWDFDDGNSSTAENPTHTYAADGTYSVTLTVTDSCGNVESLTQDVVVDSGNQPCAPLEAAFNVVNDNTDFEVSFTDISSGDINAWSWDFDDGSVNSTDQNPTHTFPGNGTYNVTLTVTDDCGDTDDTTIVVSLTVLSRGDLIDAGLELFPNPATDVVTLHLETTLDNGIFELYNLNGQLFQRQTLTPNTLEQAIRLEDVSEGVYMVRILENGTAVSQHKLIIRR